MTTGNIQDIKLDRHSLLLSSPNPLVESLRIDVDSDLIIFEGVLKIE